MSTPPVDESCSNCLLPEPLTPFLAINLITAFAAASAALLCQVLSVPVWTMFVGWVAFASRGQTFQDGIANLVCLLAGVAIGLLAGGAIDPLKPILGVATVPSFVFATSLFVMSLRALPLFNNIPAFFLGLTSVFAAHAKPEVESFLYLGLAGAIGGLAGGAARTAHERISNGRSRTAEVLSGQA